MTKYHLYFDTSQQGFRIDSMTPFGLMFVAFGILLVFWARKSGGNWRRQFGAWFYLLFSIVWTLLISLAPLGEYLQVTRAVGNGEFRITEGNVENYSFKPDGRKKTERFCVETTCFSYSKFDRIYFHQPVENGGPIRNGLRVRIGHIRHRIVRLEIAR